MVHVPALTLVTVEPLTVQTAGVVELKVTARPELAVALTVEVPASASVAGAKVIVPMVWLALPIVIFWVTCVAALYVEFPAWSAATVQVPADTPLTIESTTVQTAGVVELKVTARPELAVALAVVVPPTASVAGVNVNVPMV
jgi:hypothetical protein